MIPCLHCGFSNQLTAAQCVSCGRRLQVTANAGAEAAFVAPQKLRLQPGSIVVNGHAKYEIQKEIGSGGFGTVYLANNRHNQPFALKLLHLWEIHPLDQKEVIHRFKREYEAGKITSPYIVHSLDHGEMGGNPFIVMDYCANGDLRKKMNRRWDEPQVNRVAAHILKGLSHLHQSGIIHRDLKPENVLFDANDRAMLCDFGISGFLQNRSTKADWRGHVKSVFGTVVYMPPEQLDPRIAFKSVGPVTDIFGFGVLMYELLTQGKLPFGDLEDFSRDRQEFYRRVKKGNFTDIRHYRPDISPTWVAIINTCLQPDPNSRFADTAEILRELPVANTSSGNTKPAAPKAPVPPPPNIDKGSTALQVMNGDEYGRFYNLTALMKNKNKPMLTLGWFNKKKPYENDIPITETYTRYVSTHHATLECSNGIWYVRDGQWRAKNGEFAWLTSKNGTWLNAAQVGMEGKPIRQGDIITVGDTTLRVVVS